MSDEAPLPLPVLARRNRLNLSLVWIVPIVAAVAGLVLVLRALLSTGPEITIAFRSAEGLEAGRTEVRFKEVMVGRVKLVQLTPDRQKVLVTVNLAKSAAGLAVEDTRFWVVRPRIGTAGISGLSTLFSGSYIGVDAGESEESRRDFVGQDNPPLVLRGEPGRSFVLRADDLGSLDVGSGIYFRRVRVGRVVGFTLDEAGRNLMVRIFIESPHERLVTTRSRFWNASGMELSVGADGLRVQTQSLASVLAGGIAFSNPPPDAAVVTAAAEAGRLFTLHASERDAIAPADGEPLRVEMVFDQSLRGLEVGAPVELMGVAVGSVRSVELQPAGRGLAVKVGADLYTLRLGRLREQLLRGGQGAGPGAGPGGSAADRQLLAQFVNRGLRAQARTGSLLTGQLYVAMEFPPPGATAKKTGVVFDAQAEVPRIPTTPGTLSELQPRLMDIVDRVSRVPVDQISTELQEALRELKGSGSSLQATLASADALIRELKPEAQQALADARKAITELQGTLGTATQTLRNADASLADPQAPLQRSANATLAEMQRAANALRVLADYLQRHPESLLRGQPPDVSEKPR